MTFKTLLPVLLMLVVFALSRVPGLLPQNFSAAYALAFCAGVYFRGPLGWALPLGALFVTDTVLNLFCYDAPVLNGYLAVKAAAFAVLIALGRRFRPESGAWRLLGGGLLGAVLFYLLTNTASWIFNPGYVKNLAGWWQALTSGLPGYPPTWEFFRNTLLSGGLFTALFVGAMKILSAAESSAEKEPAAEPEGAEPQPEESKA